MNDRPAAAARRQLAASLLVLPWMLGGCAALLGPRTITISEAELRRRLQARFPIDERLLELLDLHLAAPRVSLKPEVNRIEVAFDLRLDERLTSRSFPTTIALDSALHYDVAQAAVRLVDVRMRSLRIDGLPPSVVDALLQLGTPVAERLLEGTAVYRLSAEQLSSAAGRGWRPDAIAVTPRGIEMTLLPVRGS